MWLEWMERMLDGGTTPRRLAVREERREMAELDHAGDLPQFALHNPLPLAGVGRVRDIATCCAAAES
jgi:hypothetical protein